MPLRIFGKEVGKVCLFVLVFLRKKSILFMGVIYGLLGSYFWKQFWKQVFWELFFIFIEQKYVWKSKMFFNSFLIILKIIFIFSILFLYNYFLKFLFENKLK